MDALSVDLCDFGKLTSALDQCRPAAIVHLAGIAAPTHRNVGQTYSANVVGTANLFEALAAAQIEPRIIVVASSGQLYAPSCNETPLSESDPIAPKSHYAVSKRATEEIATINSRRFPVIITRPFNYTGPDQSADFLVPKVVQHYVAKLKEVRVGNLELFRDFSDISRVVEAYFRLVTQSIEPTTVNICSGRPVYLADIIKMMDEISGWHVEPVADPLLYRNQEPRFIVGSPHRLESLVGALPNPEFRQTLVQMYDWLCQRRGGNVA